MGSIEKRIIQVLKAHSASDHLFEEMSTNLAFIIKHVAGPKVTARQISITFTLASYDNDYVGDTVTVSVHMSKGNLRVIAAAQVDDETDITEALQVEVNKRVEEILEKDGDDALGDDE